MPEERTLQYFGRIRKKPDPPDFFIRRTSIADRRTVLLSAEQTAKTVPAVCALSG